QRPELEGEFPFVRFDECIYPASIRVKLLAILGRQSPEPLLGGGTDSEYSLLTVVIERDFTNDLRQFARGGATEEIHLKKSVLRGDVSLGKKQVAQGGGFNRRHSLAIAGDANRSGNAHNRNGAVKRRQCGMGVARKQNSCHAHNRNGNERQQWNRTAEARLSRGRRSLKEHLGGHGSIRL